MKLITHSKSINFTNDNKSQSKQKNVKIFKMHQKYNSLHAIRINNNSKVHRIHVQICTKGEGKGIQNRERLVAEGANICELRFIRIPLLTQSYMVKQLV